jgi:repressor of nif and glnA expression
MSYKDRNRGYMLIYGGANFFAPLVEQGIAGELSISHSIYQSERMKPVDLFSEDFPG